MVFSFHDVKYGAWSRILVCALPRLHFAEQRRTQVEQEQSVSPALLSNLLYLLCLARGGSRVDAQESTWSLHMTCKILHQFLPPTCVLAASALIFSKPFIAMKLLIRSKHSQVAPTSALLGEGLFSCLCLPPHQPHILLVGTGEGCLLLWDLREPVASSHAQVRWPTFRMQYSLRTTRMLLNGR